MLNCESLSMYEQFASVPVDLVILTDCFQEHTHVTLCSGSVLFIVLFFNKI